MLLPQTVERSYRFKLALRMGLPIFALIIAFISHTLITTYTTLETSFYIEAVILLVLSIYFILYLIYNGFGVKITDDVTKTFTREYLYGYLEKEIARNKEYTLLLVSVDNLNDINNVYGIKNGDKVLLQVCEWLENYLKEEGIENYPIGHIKGGDIVLGLKGNKKHYRTVLDLMCLKSQEFRVDDIEVKISGAITDTHYSKDINHLVEHLFELLEDTKNFKEQRKDDSIDPNTLELYVIDAIKEQKIVVSAQKVETQEDFYECFIKLKGQDGKYIFPKSYIKVINKLGLGVDFDLMVLEFLVQKCTHKEGVLALNIFPTSLRNDKFINRAKELLAHKKLSFVFVLYEMEYYSNMKKFNAILESFKEYNVRFAIDRVGSIHSSFLYLRELDIDFIRFDTFYSKYEKMEKNRNILDGFNLIAHEKSVKSWIKNIEDEQSYTLAKEIGIDMIQGKYIAQVEKILEEEI